MLSNKFFPYSSMQEINLDWILTKVKNLMRFLPDDGSVGQILRRTAHGAEWSNEQGGGGAVTSVNGQTGTVVLTASDVGALPDTYTAPVDSVNGQTGAVVLTIPTDTGDLTNGAGYVDAAGAAAAAPVQSVNGQTGAVVLGASDVGALADTTVIPDSTSDLINDSGFVDAAGAAAAAPVQSVNGQTGAVVIPTGTPEEVSITTVSGWNSNNTHCYKIDNLVLVQFYVQGTPSNGKQIATGLPIPTTTPQTASGSSPSVVRIDGNGVLYIQSAGTGAYIGGTFVYMTS